jgi:type I restriction enzyme S subunit
MLASFFDWLTKTRAFVEFCIRASSGTTNRLYLQEEVFLDQEILLPPPAEQQRIVARIEAVAAQVQEAQGLRRCAIEEANTLLGGSAVALFEAGWPRVCLEDVTSLITDGTHQTPQYVEMDGHVFLSAQNIKPFRFMPESHRKVSYDDYRGCQVRVKPQKGDVLLTRVGAGIGEAAVIDRDLDFAFYVSLALIRPIDDQLLPQYLVHWLNSPEGREKSRKQTLGTGHSQGNLNLKLIRQFELPLPPISEQSRIVADLDAMQVQIGALSHIQTETSAELDALLPAILDKAFRGELV